MCVKKDKHGFVFGINNLLAAVLQSLATIFMNMGNLSSSKDMVNMNLNFIIFNVSLPIYY